MKGKYVVATVGMASAAALGIVNVIFKGPNTAVTLAIVSSITFVAGLAFGYVKS